MINLLISNEYHTAVFILIPQLETFTKRIAEKVGIPVIKKVPEGIQDKTLGDFLLDEDFKNIIGDDLNTYLLWSRNSQNPRRFSRKIETFYVLRRSS